MALVHQHTRIVINLVDFKHVHHIRWVEDAEEELNTSDIGRAMMKFYYIMRLLDDREHGVFKTLFKRLRKAMPRTPIAWERVLELHAIVRNGECSFPVDRWMDTLSIDD